MYVKDHRSINTYNYKKSQQIILNKSTSINRPKYDAQHVDFTTN